jgi:cell wall-associated NlpC family hydrolase
MSSAAGAAKGAAVVSAAKTYIGVPYKWAGASRAGVDCSGLVLLAYKTIGIKLPHLADAQMRKGRIIPQARARAGDLVGWPSPARYSHIGILVDAGHVIEARTTGTKVGIFPLGRRAGGPPTFARLVPD